MLNKRNRTEIDERKRNVILIAHIDFFFNSFKNEAHKENLKKHGRATKLKKQKQNQTAEREKKITR